MSVIKLNTDGYHGYIKYVFKDIDDKSILCQIKVPENHWVFDSLFGNTKTFLFGDKLEFYFSFCNAESPMKISYRWMNTIGWEAENDNLDILMPQFLAMEEWLNKGEHKTKEIALKYYKEWEEANKETIVVDHHISLFNSKSRDRWDLWKKQLHNN